jgi:hypothetical protein
MCSQTNHVPYHEQACRHNECCSHSVLLSKKKKLEILNNCLNCLKEKETDIHEAIAELNDNNHTSQGGS